MINLWRNSPVFAPKEKGPNLAERYIFPSGRQAITYCLTYSKLKREDRVAIPEWSSNCVINAIGKVCTPIPFHEVLENRIKVSAVLLYDQWGWPNTTSNSLKKIEEITKCKILIHDAVDSFPFKLNLRVPSINEDFVKKNGPKKIYTIFSMSKSLGLSSGGLLFFNNRGLMFKNFGKNNFEEKLQLKKLKDKNEYLSSFLKSENHFLEKELKEWLELNDLFQAFEVEKRKRKINLKKVSNSKLALNWPAWMFSSLDEGFLPGIVPFFRESSEHELKQKQNELSIKHQIQSIQYHFNWSNNSLEPEYGKCLAIPTHGMVSDIDEIINTLES